MASNVWLQSLLLVAALVVALVAVASAAEDDADRFSRDDRDYRPLQGNSRKLVMQTGRVHWRPSNIRGSDMDIVPQWRRYQAFGKRADFRPLQFGKKDSYRPLQFGKRGYERYTQMLMRPVYTTD